MTKEETSLSKRIKAEEEISRSNKKQPSNKKKKGKSILWKFLLLFFIFLCVVGGIGGSIFYKYVKNAPELDFTKLEDTLSASIFDIKGEVILELGEKKREEVSVNNVPQKMKDAITSIEDKRFNKHPGVDPIRIVGAAISNLKGNKLQGGSTLTQQLIKLSYYSTKEKDQTYERKAQEAWLSLQLERKKSKDEIMAYYINKVYMSNGLYGMETAAKSYYGKKLSELNLPQTALLAGLPQAPAAYDPYAHPDKAKDRRDLVLNEMYKDKKVTQEEYEEAINTPIEDSLLPLAEESEERKIIDNYIKQVIEEVNKKTKRNIYTDGMDIYTNIDMEAQRFLYNLVNSDEYIEFPSDEFQTAVTLLDVKTGQVRAQIGGRKIADDVQLGDNLAVTAKRDVGSTVKPIVDYAPAIEYLNYGSGRYVVDAPYKYPETNIPVYNYDKKYRGSLTIREALVDSRNVPAVKTLDEVGLEKSEEFLKGLGIHYPKGMFHSKAISGEISSLKLAAAYAAFANNGLYNKPYYVSKIVYPDGKEEHFQPESNQAMKPATAYIITDILKDVIRRGTGYKASIEGLVQAGKTGTSNYKDDVEIIGDSYSGVPDITFVGYTPNYAISVWTGNRNYKHAISYEDQSIAALIYKYLMEHMSLNLEPIDWEIPEDAVRVGNEVYVKDHVNNQGKWSSSSSYNNYSSNNNYGNNNNYTPPQNNSQAPSTSSSASDTGPVAPPATSEEPAVVPPAESQPATPVEPPTSSEAPPIIDSGNTSD